MATSGNGSGNESFEVEKDNTKEVSRAIERAILVALEEIGLLCEGYAKKQCPVDTGRLRNSITHRVFNGGEKYVIVGTNVEYGKYVELGTSRQKAQPYLRPAANEHVEQYRRVVQSKLSGA